MSAPDASTRQRILEAALRRFAECGYAGTSVQDIVDGAQVTKPALYYYFQSKAGLFQALLDWANDERYRLMLEAARTQGSTPARLVEILAGLFGFLNGNRELMRLAFATAFAAPGEIPPEISYLPKCERNFELLHSAIREGIAAGELDDAFESKQLAMGLYGLMNIHVMAWLVDGREALTRETAEQIIRLYLQGAGRKG